MADPCPSEMRWRHGARLDLQRNLHTTFDPSRRGIMGGPCRRPRQRSWPCSSALLWVGVVAVQEPAPLGQSRCSEGERGVWNSKIDGCALLDWVSLAVVFFFHLICSLCVWCSGVVPHPYDTETTLCPVHGPAARIACPHATRLWFTGGRSGWHGRHAVHCHLQPVKCSVYVVHLWCVDAAVTSAVAPVQPGSFVLVPRRATAEMTTFSNSRSCVDHRTQGFAVCSPPR